MIGRRTFLQILALAGAAGGLYGYGLLRSGGRGTTVRQSRIMMGTQINLIIHGPDQEQCQEGITATFARMEALERDLSRHRADSALSRLNAEGRLIDAPADLLSVLTLAENISRASDGAFDVTVLPLLRLYARGHIPSQAQLSETLSLVDYRRVERRGEAIVLGQPGMGLTFDGIAKGYVVDQGVATLRQSGFTNVYVEAGGDLMVTGNKPAGAPWRIGIREPRADSSTAMTVLSTTSPLAVATSGDYMQAFTEDLRHHHILDPRTGMSPPELASATITAPSVALADGLATAAMVLGPKRAMAMLQEFAGCEGLFIDKRLHHHTTSGFQG
jgi:thiamine biosynthesis lipoprotein